MPLKIFSGSLSDAQAVVLGSGRFIRALLVPILDQLDMKTIIMQPRGTDFIEYLSERESGDYEVDVSLLDGSVLTQTVHSVLAVGSLGIEEDTKDFLRLPFQLPHLSLIGVGVTEAGLQADSPAMNQLGMHSLAGHLFCDMCCSSVSACVL